LPKKPGIKTFYSSSLAERLNKLVRLYLWARLICCGVSTVRTER
jgi:hypothetical protein